MKKVLALTLATATAASMGLTGFANEVADIDSFAANYTLWDGYVDSADVDESTNRDRRSVDMGTIIVQDEVESIINLEREMFGVEDVSIFLDDDVFLYADPARIASSNYPIFINSVNQPTSWSDLADLLVEQARTPVVVDNNNDQIGDFLIEFDNIGFAMLNPFIGRFAGAAPVATKTQLENTLLDGGNISTSHPGFDAFNQAAKDKLGGDLSNGDIIIVRVNPYNVYQLVGGTWQFVASADTEDEALLEAQQAGLATGSRIISNIQNVALFDENDSYNTVLEAVMRQHPGILPPGTVDTGTQDWRDHYDYYMDRDLVKGAATSDDNRFWIEDEDGNIITVEAGELAQNQLDDGALIDGNLTSTEIRENNIGVYVQTQEESRAVKEVRLDRATGTIEIDWATRFVSVDSSDFTIIVALSFDGRRDDDNSITFTGDIENEEIMVYADTNSVNIENGVVADAVEFNDSVALYVGNGATVHTKLFKDKKYYCDTSRDPDEEDDIVFRQYPDVDNVVTFYPVGVNATGDYVTLSTDYDGYYVYDADMNYLGRGNETLEFSKKFYLANRRLDVEDDVEEEPTTPAPAPDYETPAEVAPNPQGGGDTAANNANNNPGTGK